MKTLAKILSVLLWLTLALWAFFFASCASHRSERFYGNKDSISYMRTGNIEVKWIR